MSWENTYLVAALGAMLMSGCSKGRTFSSATAFTNRGELAEFTENFVRVSLGLETDPEGKPVLRATFTPTEEGFHLYGKDLPEEGINGLGGPTRLDIVSGSIQSAGPMFVDRNTRDEDTLGVKLPIYPEGPVTLRQPISIVRPGDKADVELSYMSCKSGGVCHPPVHRKRVEIRVPKV